jgi:hypothetical protein
VLYLELIEIISIFQPQLVLWDVFGQPIPTPRPTRVRARAGALCRPSRPGAGPRRSAEAGGLPTAPEATVERRWDSAKERRAGVLTGRLEGAALPARS